MSISKFIIVFSLHLKIPITKSKNKNIPGVQLLICVSSLRSIKAEWGYVWICWESGCWNSVEDSRGMCGGGGEAGQTLKDVIQGGQGVQGDFEPNGHQL